VIKLVAAFVSVALSVTIGIAAIATGDTTNTTAPPSALAVAEIPPSLLPVYQHAAATCDGLPWEVLAAIGWLESRHAAGHADPTTGDVTPPIIGAPLDGRDGGDRIADPTSPDGWLHAQGPMQFLPATWTRWARLAPGRPAGTVPSIQNAWDSIHTAAAYLCQGATMLADLRAAVDAYAGSTDYYPRVIAKATEYGYGQTAPAGDVGVRAVGFALRELGVPYVYGAESPEQGFDCSGLLYWAYAQAGVQIPRVTYDEVRVGVAVLIADLRPGDLIFSRGDVPIRDYGHVAMYIGNGTEINAPHTGAVVSLRPIDPQRIQAIRRIAS
jgi:Cell wall-associated hydrolases (invasion-associated proteins)